MPAEGKAGLERALDELFKAADQAIAGGANILILSDRASIATMRRFRRCWPRLACIIT